MGRISALVVFKDHHQEVVVLLAILMFTGTCVSVPLVIHCYAYNCLS